MRHYTGDGCELYPPHSAHSVAHALAMERASVKPVDTEPVEERRSPWRQMLDSLGLRSTGRPIARHPDRSNPK